MSARAKKKVDVKKPVVVARPKTAVNLIKEVIDKYISFGWTVIKIPPGSINDIIAQKAARVHFVQIITKDTAENAKFHGLAKNTFIQNAFSNGAVPVYSRVVTSGQPPRKITFENVNEGTRVIIGCTRRTPAT